MVRGSSFEVRGAWTTGLGPLLSPSKEVPHPPAHEVFAMRQQVHTAAVGLTRFIGPAQMADVPARLPERDSKFQTIQEFCAFYPDFA